jgi:hypothetical protein
MKRTTRAQRKREEEEELEEGEDLSLGATSDEDLNLQPWRAGNGSEEDESRGGRSNGRSHDAQKEREERERVERAGDDKALVKFVKFALSPQMKHTTFIAHNSAKFDGILLIEILLKLNVKVETVFDGQKLLCLKVPINDIRFIDSFRYIKSALEKFPSRFPDMTDAAKNVQYSRGDMEEEEEEEEANKDGLKNFIWPREFSLIKQIRLNFMSMKEPFPTFHSLSTNSPQRLKNKKRKSLSAPSRKSGTSRNSFTPTL